jgi:hypothetical protein
MAENSISSVFETISGFCSSLQVDSNKSLKISIIHDNFSLGSIIGAEVIAGNLSPESKKLKLSKCSVLDQTSEEYFYVYYGNYMGLIS